MQSISVDAINNIILDILASWIRMFVALAIAIIFSIFVGISAATNKKMERVILPVLDILQTIPILGFFPIVIYLIVQAVPGSIGINLAVVFLIFTSVVWNITFGVYEAIKEIPDDLIDLFKFYRYSAVKKIRDLYIPYSIPKIAYQTSVSFSVGMFYLVASEIFSVGSNKFSVTYGIGVAISSLTASSNIILYATTIALLLFAIILTRIFVLNPFSRFSEKFYVKNEQTYIRRSKILAFYYKIFNVLKRIFSFIAPIFKIPAVLRFEKSIIKDETSIRHMIRINRRERIAINTLEYPVIFLILIFIIYLLAFSNVNQYLSSVYTALVYSFARVWFVYILCVLIAVPLGIKIGLSKMMFEPSMSFIQVTSAVPATVLFPAIVYLFRPLLFGNEIVAFLIIFFSMIWYLFFSIVSGIRGLSSDIQDMSSSLRLSRFRAWKEIYIPAILPSFVTGSITAIGGGWNALIIAEYFSVQTGSTTIVLNQVNIGLGKILDQSVFSNNLPLTMLAISVMVFMVLIINSFVWKRLYNKITVKYRMV